MPSLPTKTEVLVVGAGPAGLLAALELSRAGVAVQIIDRADRSSAQSYACGLHSSSVALLERSGLDLSRLQARAHINTLAFYEGAERRAELRVGGPSHPSRSGPGLCVVPQDQLESLLEEALESQGVTVRWGHRLDDIRQEDHAAVATVEKLGLTSGGYPVAVSEEMVERVIQVRSPFILGADGAASHVRQVLGISTRPCGPTRTHEVLEFKPAKPYVPDTEVRIAVGPHSIDTLWPQPGGLCRWNLELTETTGEHPLKERHAFVVVNNLTDPAERQSVTDRIRARAPWFDAGIAELDWRTLVDFEPMVATRFGEGRCWLAGDAGHQTSPAGMQSMNVGLREASDLASRLARIVRQGAPPALLEDYNRERLAEWAEIHGQTETMVAGPTASRWAASHRRRLLSCLPESGPALRELASQLGFVAA